MAITPETLRAGGPGSPARPLVVSRARTNRRIVLDRWASRLVVVGGLVIVASILAILVVITAQVYPLFRPPSATAGAAAALGAAPAGVQGA
ncbi:MAG TPA: ABC transporter permease, partial [Methylomirabilota bacterium]|nr:ABC transporter permease [Methylomirabilota bacterium]